MTIILTYDLHKDHEQVKDGLIKLGWKKNIKGTNFGGLTPSFSLLPNTTLVKENTTVDQSLEDLLSVTTKSNIISAFSSEINNWKSYNPINNRELLKGFPALMAKKKIS